MAFFPTKFPRLNKKFYLNSDESHYCQMLNWIESVDYNYRQFSVFGRDCLLPPEHAAKNNKEKFPFLNALKH